MISPPTHSISLRPHIEARLQVEAEKRGLTLEAFAAEIITTLLEDALTDEAQNATIEYMTAILQSVNPKSAVERLHRDRREDLAREEAKFERLAREGKRHSNP